LGGLNSQPIRTSFSNVLTSEAIGLEVLLQHSRSTLADRERRYTSKGKRPQERRVIYCVFSGGWVSGCFCTSAGLSLLIVLRTRMVVVVSFKQECVLHHHNIEVGQRQHRVDT
jgi:hypothetical protein